MAAVLREYIAHFRIKELQQCLEQLGLSKRGRKLDLQNRLLAYLGETETVAGPGQTTPDIWRADAAGRVITQIWRQMHGLPDATPQAQDQTALQERIASSLEASTSNAKLTDGMHALGNHGGLQPYQHPAAAAYLVGAHNTQINCICGDNSDRGTMVQCEDDSCGIWQHCNCVAVDPMAMPDHYYCQNCRVALADPFWQVTDHRLIPAAMLRLVPGRPVVMRSTGKEQMLAAERSFDLTSAQLDPLRKNPQTEQLHVACLMINDTVSNRMHWPRQAELRINNMVYRPYGRNSNTKLGNNARDEPANAAHKCVVGRNRVSLSCAEDRQFCLLAYTVRRRTLEAVKKLMAPAETPEKALARIMSTLQGSKPGEEDDDDDLVVSNTVISLKDPLSGTRIRVAARFSGVQGIVAFDFDNFMSMVQRSRKWQDPHTLRNVTVKQLQTDSWMQAVLNCLKGVVVSTQHAERATPLSNMTMTAKQALCPKVNALNAMCRTITEVEVNADGSWRPASADMAWLSTLKDTAPLTKAQVTKPQLAVKPDPDRPADDDSEAESEGEELRKAARAFAAANKQSKAEPEVIVLDDSSDDDAPAQQPQAAAPRYVWPANGNAAAQPSQSQQHRQVNSRPSHNAHDAVPNRLHAAALTVDAGFSSSPQSSWGQASSQQHPAAQQAARSATANAHGSANGPLRIKLPTRPLDRHQAPQQPSRLARTTNGLHSAASASSASQLADATRALSTQQQQQPRQLPTSHLGKRKQQDLSGHNGPYSQAAAQASGMSTLDQLHGGRDNSAELRHPQPYGANASAYAMPQMYGQMPYTSSYSWQAQAHGNPGSSSSPYSCHAMGSPGYSSGYSGLHSMQEQSNAAADAASLQPPSYGLPDANHLVPDGDSFMDAVIDWPSDRSLSGSETSDARKKEARLAAWKARQVMPSHTIASQHVAVAQQAQDDVIVLD